MAIDADENDDCFDSHGLVSSGGVGNNLQSLVDGQIVTKRGS